MRAFAPAVLALLVILGLGASWITPYAPDALDLSNRRAAPSVAHWFGTDELGRDVCSRVLHGARVSLAVGLLAAAVSTLVGVGIGSASGYAGGGLDTALMRVTDAILAVPRVPLLMVAAAILAPSLAALVLLVGLVGWMETARLVRAELLSLKTRDFVEAARASGGGALWIVRRHLLPNAAPVIAVSTTLAVGRSVLLESTLSFFGVGVQPPTASWGTMLYQAQTTMSTEPWLALFPGLFIFVTMLSVNALGEQLAVSR